MLQTNKCLQCGEVLHGRVDKKFCGDQCRATYNNRMKRKHEAFILSTNKTLRRNRTILRSLCPLGKATVRREALEEMGFDFSKFTSLYKMKELTYYLSYEYGFAPIVERSISEGRYVQKVLIIQKQSFMDGTFDPWSW